MPDTDESVVAFSYRNKAYENDDTSVARNHETKENWEPVIHTCTDNNETTEAPVEAGKDAVNGSGGSTGKAVERNEKENSDEGLDDPPDGGWGWIVAIGAFISQTMVNTILPAYGILYSEFLLGLETSALVSSWIYNLMVFTMMLSGLFLKAFIEEFGLRMTGFLGTILIFIGTIATAFADSPWFIMFFYSFVVGMGNGLLGPLSYGIPSYYFKRRVGIANAIMSSGVSLGQIVGPLLITRLQDQYAFRGSVIILSAFFLNAFVGTIVFHPPEWHKKKPTEVPRATKTDRSYIVLLRILKNVLKTLTLIKSPVASIVAIGGSITLMSYLNFLVLLPFFMQEEGFSVADAAYCLSLSGLANLVTRLVVSTLSDYSWFNKRYCYMAGALTIGILAVVFCLVTDSTSKFIAIGFWGGGVGICMGLINLLMIEYVGREQHINELSFNCFTSSIFFIVSGPLLGLIRDVSGSYTYSLLCLAALAIIPFLLYLFMPAAQAYEKRNKEELQKKNEEV
ncbi:monocarboxylate transporter 13-like isoform X1 [Palaemon carinicauda]|uniref:monocarboxylate transporter 13-like isoform X1 n=1 Tax=Palaemon carinicauda TaxID=392227 RepID=UPI0035B5B209